VSNGKAKVGSVGPWRAEAMREGKEHTWYVTTAGGKSAVARIMGLTEDERETNAKMAATAPELTDAVRALLEQLRETEKHYDSPRASVRIACDMGRNAVLKATGKP
jgi:hypothetical protein